MIKAAIEKILALAEPRIINECGHIYSDKTLSRLDFIPQAKPLELSTPASLVEFVKTSNDLRPDTDYYALVSDPVTVYFKSELDDDRDRETLAVVRADVPEFNFNHMLRQEDFLIGVQSKFLDDKETDKALVLKFAGTVTDGSIREFDDDGITQKATIKVGVATKSEAKIPSPCCLRPYRTFCEIEQPKSDYIFRMKQSGEEVYCALFSADGGAWQLEAKNNIAAFLKSAFAGMEHIKVLA